MTRPGFVTWTGLAVVLIAAAALSFNSLRLLAIACRVDEHLAPLLPIAVDAGAAVATRAWLSGRTGPVAEQYARRMTWCLLALTVTGNATHQLMAAEGVPAWLLVVTVIVGAVPAGVMGAAVHLAVLLGRDEHVHQHDDEPAPSPVEAAVAPSQVAATPVGPKPKPSSLAPTPDRTSAETRARALVAENPGIGRRALAQRSGVSEYVARTLLAEKAPRNGHRVLEDAK